MATSIQLCTLLLLLTTCKVHAQPLPPCIPMSTSYAFLADNSPPGTLVQEFALPTNIGNYSGEHTMPLTINVSAPATGLSSYTICGSNNSRVASHLQLLDLSNGTGLQLAIVSTQSQPDLVRLGYDSGNLTIDLCLTDNGFNKTSMYNSSLYTSLHTASARHTIILPLEEVLSSCTLPTVPRNGQVSARWLLYNESLNFTCNDGYYLTGPANVTCLDDGNVTDSARTDCLREYNVGHVIGLLVLVSV
eukprot:scpid93736/ scgid1521/ 